jgi:hypothetical protein
VEIQEICNQQQYKVIYQHIPGIQNIQADALSRQSHQSPLYEATLPKTVFNKINKHWGPLMIDAFASRTNNQLTKYWSLQPDPTATATGALAQKWLKKGMYLLPPWKLIPQVIQQIRKQNIQKTVLITPNWPTQHWYPLITQLHQIQPPQQFRLKGWTMTAWLLSGKKENPRE